MSPYEAGKLGELIGRAIARDVIAEKMPSEWSGLDPQDADLIPSDLSEPMVEIIAAKAKLAYKQALSATRNP